MKPPTSKSLKWLGVDFDETLAHNSGYPDFKLLKPTKGAREAMIKLSKNWKIIIYTSRPWADYRLIETWLKKYKIPFKDIVCGKLLVAFMIDDKNLPFNPLYSDKSWEYIVDRLYETR